MRGEQASILPACLVSIAMIIFNNTAHSNILSAVVVSLSLPFMLLHPACCTYPEMGELLLEFPA